MASRKKMEMGWFPTVQGSRHKHSLKDVTEKPRSADVVSWISSWDKENVREAEEI